MDGKLFFSVEGGVQSLNNSGWGGGLERFVFRKVWGFPHDSFPGLVVVQGRSKNPGTGGGPRDR